MNCYVYIVECEDESFYTGITWNIRRRIEQHNGLSWLPGARYTKSKRPVFLVHLERYASRSEAAKREKKIKEYSHEEKHLLIAHATKADILSAI